jgi:hypothetical protein
MPTEPVSWGPGFFEKSGQKSAKIFAIFLQENWRQLVKWQ